MAAVSGVSPLVADDVAAFADSLGLGPAAVLRCGGEALIVIPNGTIVDAHAVLAHPGVHVMTARLWPLRAFTDATHGDFFSTVELRTRFQVREHCRTAARRC